VNVPHFLGGKGKTLSLNETLNRAWDIEQKVKRFMPVSFDIQFA